MQDCCRSRCAGCVADVGCWIVADAVVEGNATTIGAGVTGLARLPGVMVRKNNLPPKSGCINHGKYFSEKS